MARNLQGSVTYNLQRAHSGTSVEDNEYHGPENEHTGYNLYGEQLVGVDRVIATAVNAQEGVTYSLERDRLAFEIKVHSRRSICL